ncbi:SRPBCC domain-containing protein [Staphylococcus gallinarum]|uniref:SRPBCC domain-containing protein n=1 Tax=Staphylococcus gallinarum TaxID=1293 RepID=UPI00211C55E4|nr:SRPBCC domain-containing protein [Staphylococcus gallinarum]MCQ9289002.1 SRPBCC domain-containing protein [Staphylococcus gallinarum]
MEVNYIKNDKGVYQTIDVLINEKPSIIFNYLSTTEGIQQWFPQLYVEERSEHGNLYFHIEDDEDLRMEILQFDEPNTFEFSWDIGTVKFQLSEQQGQTLLTLKEYLPYEFPHITLDFSGWQYQMHSLKNLIEQGEILAQSDFDFETNQQEIAQKLRL